jgi:hypothetical protein
VAGFCARSDFPPKFRVFGLGGFTRVALWHKFVWI